MFLPIARLAERWLSEDKVDSRDPETRGQIESLLAANDEDTLEKLLRNRIEFGTAGLRARMEAGYSRLNR
ncbi:hypothetical protein GGI16_001988, partial [Coemansia sp. S142-1]